MKFKISVLHGFLICALAVFLIPTTAGAGENGYMPKLPLGLKQSEYYVPKDNPMTKEKVELGRALYFDTRLSADDTIACATCHHPLNGFTDNLPVSTGINGQQGSRSAPTVINRAFSRHQFWDGRAASLEEQSKGPPFNPIEMGMSSPAELEKKIASIKGYRDRFMKVFGRDVNIDDIAKAIAAFERTVLSGNSRYDRYIQARRTVFEGKAGGSKQTTKADSKLSAEEFRGLLLFSSKGCVVCHAGPNFTDEDFHSLGVGWDRGMVDLGRYMVTKDPDDIGAFKTPTLRDITRTAPYMHDGSIKTLEGVVEFYNRGGVPNPYLSGVIEPLNLTKQEVKAIVAFLKTLEGEGWTKITPPDSFPE